MSDETRDLKKYSGWWGWEQHLTDQERHGLALTRASLEPEDEEDFALAYADLHSSGDLEDLLEEVGNDSRARALVRLEAELDCYPYRFDTMTSMLLNS